METINNEQIKVGEYLMMTAIKDHQRQGMPGRLWRVAAIDPPFIVLEWTEETLRGMRNILRLDLVTFARPSRQFVDAVLGGTDAEPADEQWDESIGSA